MNAPRKERVLITVKTYPTLSAKYVETVCTAGIREDGSWVRIYPVPFRRLGETEQYRLFDWVECQLERNVSDYRPESFRPLDLHGFRTVGHIDTRNNWRERRRAILEKSRIYDRFEDVIDRAKAREISLAVFKPAQVTDFTWRASDREWNPQRLDKIQDLAKQNTLFEEEAWGNTFKIVEKIPYDFSYSFKDISGKTRKLTILEWQLGALYRNCLKSCDGNEQEALVKVRQKYFDEFVKTDLHFFIGTTLQFHSIAPNPWMIIGVFPIPRERQPDLGLLEST